MEEVVLRKGLRLSRRRRVGPIELRGEVSDWLVSLSESSHYAVPVIVRAIIEDAYDRELCISPDSEEVTPDA